MKVSLFYFIFRLSCDELTMHCQTHCSHLIMILSTGWSCRFVAYGWRCDGCRGHHDENFERHRCIRGCDYDLCIECFESSTEAPHASVDPDPQPDLALVDSSKPPVAVPIIYDLLQSVPVSVLRSVFQHSELPPKPIDFELLSL